MAKTEQPPTPAELNRFQAWVLAHLAAGTKAIACVGGWGCGKTHLLAIAMHALTRQRPSEDGMVVYPRAAQAAKALGALAESVLIPQGWRFCATYQGQQAPHWLSPFGPRVWVVSYYRPGTVAMAANSLEGINAGWAFIDEAPAFAGSEVADMAWGRVRDGSRPVLVIMGRPSLHEWWPEWTTARGGAYQRVSSRVNRKHIRGWSAWVEQMTEAERDERLDCRPVSPEGAIFADWRVASFPDGNITPPGWKYNPASMRGFLAVDWGARHPSALVLVHDEAIGADVVVAELNPSDVSVHTLAKAINRIAAPRASGRAGVFLLDEGVGDKAGKQRNDQTLRSNFDALAALPTDTPPGIGMRLGCRYEHHAARTSVVNGVREMRARVLHEHHGRRLLMTHECWAASMTAKGVSLARAMGSYVYRQGSDEPVKNGCEHPIDALRYFVAEFRWPSPQAAVSSHVGGALLPRSDMIGVR
jgi:hypothetical protein